MSDLSTTEGGTITTAITPVEPGADLATLAERINASHRASQSAARSVVEHAVKAGELLNEAKAAVPHGQWAVWLGKNCEFSERTAQLYMRLARELPNLDEAKAQRVADLPLRDVVRLLADPSVEATGCDLYEEALRLAEQLCDVTAERERKSADEIVAFAGGTDRLFKKAREKAKAYCKWANADIDGPASNDLAVLKGHIERLGKLQNLWAEVTILTERICGKLLTACPELAVSL